MDLVPPQSNLVAFITIPPGDAWRIGRAVETERRRSKPDDYVTRITIAGKQSSETQSPSGYSGEWIELESGFRETRTSREFR